MDNLNGNTNGGNEILEENSIVPQELFIILWHKCKNDQNNRGFLSTNKDDNIHRTR